MQIFARYCKIGLYAFFWVRPSWELNMRGLSLWSSGPIILKAISTKLHFLRKCNSYGCAKFIRIHDDSWLYKITAIFNQKDLFKMRSFRQSRTQNLNQHTTRGSLASLGTHSANHTPTPHGSLALLGSLSAPMSVRLFFEVTYVMGKILYFNGLQL